MPTAPSFDAFRELAQQGNVVPVYRVLKADLHTPVLAYLKLSKLSPYSFLLESVERGEEIGRHTYVGADPFLTVTARGTAVTIDRGGDVERRDGSVFEVLRELSERYQPVGREDLPPFSVGAVGYVGYDTVRLIEPRVPPHDTDDLDVADAVFLFFDKLLSFDYVTQRLYVIVNVRVDESEGSLEDAYRNAVRELDRLEEALDAPVAVPRRVPAPAELNPLSNVGKERHCESVEKAREYIFAGDVFQVVLSQRLQTPIAAEPFQIYRELRTLNPSPYMYFLQMGETSVVGSSPEMLVKVVGRDCSYRPIAGTRPRGKTPQEDIALERELLADEKELAEHVMLVDLGRNDLGRVCEYGSVQVKDFEVIERYSHVMHIVSRVTGKLREDQDIFDALMACFPAGTVSGAPKVRAMEIISELEPTRRGVYSGSVLYLDFAGNLNSCIAIRTMVARDGVAYIQAGGGIVADSVPETEWEETMNKAGALLAAIRAAHEVG